MNLYTPLYYESLLTPLYYEPAYINMALIVLFTKVDEVCVYIHQAEEIASRLY